MKKGIKYGFVLPGFIILGILLLLLIAALVIQTQPAKRKIARVAETQVSKFINGNLSIGKIEGNFFSHLALNNVVVTMNRDTMANIDKIETKYNLLPLLRNTLHFYSVQITRPQIFLKQVNDSVWNVQQLIKPGPKKQEPKSESSGSFNIQLPDFQLLNGFIRTETTDTIIPQRIEKLNIKLSAVWGENEKQAELKQFSFATKNPDFRVNRLEFILSQKNEFIELQNFRIETALNQVSGKAGFSPEQKTGEADFEIPDLKISEFSYFLPYLKFPATPTINLEAGMKENVTRATIRLEDQNQSIVLQANSENLSEFLFDAENITLSYSLDAKFSDVDLIHWLGIPDLPYTLNGNLSVNGSGIDPKTANIALRGELNNWVFQDKKLDKISFDLSLNQGNIAGLLQGKGEFGSFRLSPNIKNLFDVPVYQANLTAKNLNIERLTGIENLNSDINLTGRIHGKGFVPEEISASARMNILNSRFQHIPIDTLFTRAAFGNQNLEVDTLLAKNQRMVVTASGNYSLTSRSDLELKADFSGVDYLYAYLPDSSLQTNGTIQARLQGQPDDLLLEATAELDSSRYGEIAVANLNLNATGQVTATDTLFNVKVRAQEILTGELFVDSVSARAEGNLDSLFFAANLAARELTTEIKGGLFPGEPLKISLANWEVEFKKQKWILQKPPAIIELAAKNYRVENFNMVSDHDELEQFISADGQISFTGEQDFNLEISGLNLENLMLLLEQDQPVSGFFGIKVELQGNPDSLLLDSRFSITEPGFDKLKLQEISGKIEFDNNQVFVETLVATDDSGKIELTAQIPLKINVDSLNVTLPRESALDGKINMENISLARLEEMEITDQVTGIFEGELDFSGTVEQPVMQGNFKFNDTKINDYRILQFDGNLNYKNNILAADLNVVPHDSGKLVADVGIPFRFNPDSLKFGFSPKDSVYGNVNLDKMTLESLQAMFPGATISGMVEGDINLSGTVESPNPEGNIKLQKAMFILPEYGIDYREIRLNLNFQRDKAIVNDLLIRSPDGNLTGTGQVDFASDFYQGDVSQSEIDLKFNGFQPFSHRQFNMQVNGNASLGGKKGEVAYSGNLTIPSSEIYIPFVLRMLGRISAPELPKPILIEELEAMKLKDDTSFVVENQPLNSDTVRFDYLDNFKGNLRIQIPRNTWIKNDDMYIEVSGDLELRKNYDFFELFGSVEVVRGQYDLLGKTFIIKEGSISFQGGEEMMPNMDITASYSFRNQQRVEQNLTVQISGTAESPEVNFQLDGSSISEGDALSYILFGKSMNELTIDEQDNMSDAGGASLAGKAAASILASQLTNFLGDKLAVDYIEVKSDGGFDNATVVVGKYITNDLFVSYEQRFGETHEKDLKKYEVKLEYELFRFLFFELNNSSRSSGFDVIFKFDVK